jgi:2-oxoglutarate ferredoxin oxidoreductase subunit alpha
MGQMIQDVKVAAQNRWPVKLIHRTGGIVPSSIEITEKTLELLKEVQG